MSEGATYPLSEALAAILEAQSPDPRAVLHWGDLRSALATAFCEHTEAVSRLIAKREATLEYGKLMLSLIKLIKHDSAVRDVLTTGHLAKLLSRYDYLSKPEGYEIIGLLNPLFDKNSQLERAKYFDRNSSFGVSTRVLANQDAQQMIDNEKAILQNFGFGDSVKP
jgi:hypothetical protein